VKIRNNPKRRLARTRAEGRAPRRVTNVRDDKLRSSGFWRESFEGRRCLLSASSFCEPNGDVKPATWHWFALRGDEPRPLFAFPGIWQRHRGPIKKGWASCKSRCLRVPHHDAELARGHSQSRAHARATDARREFETWSTGSADDAFALAREYAPDQMRIVQDGLDKEDLLAV
jgi:putative SOS response-associated peptidase YedK